MNRFATYEEENIHYWTHRAPGYSGVNQEELATDQKRVWGRTIQERIAARFPGRKPGSIRVLDVGTGPGFFAIILARMGYQVTAVDYTASMLEEARRNAGALADKIDFHQMNAEELMFADYSFDVLVTRNVTWNLHDPEKAYSHWTRVLAPGGLLLNFDANWYRYLWDEEAELGHKRDRENLAVSDVRDENAGTDVDAMEAIARKTPLSRQHRPQWDLRVERLCIQASADREHLAAGLDEGGAHQQRLHAHVPHRGAESGTAGKLRKHRLPKGDIHFEQIYRQALFAADPGAAGHYLSVLCHDARRRQRRHYRAVRQTRAR